jgi:hypothetical protein
MEQRNTTVLQERIKPGRVKLPKRLFLALAVWRSDHPWLEQSCSKRLDFHALRRNAQLALRML